MKLKRRIAAGLVLAIGASLAIVSVAVAATVHNGSFEHGAPIPANSFITVPAGNSTTIAGWTVASGNVDYINGYWQAADGTRSIDLNGSTAGSVSQTFPTVVGVTYTVRFGLAGNPEGGPAVKTGTVTATGGAVQTFSFDTTGKTKAAMGWTGQSYSFTATVASTTLTFASTTNVGSFYGPALDHVSISDNIVTTKDQCKDGGWEHRVDSHGNSFKNQGDCVSFIATGGKNAGSIAP